MRKEYRRIDFDTLLRGKYHDRVRQNSNVVVLAPDVAKAFPNSAAVNQALLGIMVRPKRTSPAIRRSGVRKLRRKAG